MANQEPTLGQIFITRPNMRDGIRRKLGLTPPIDNVDGATAGEEPAGESWPSNVLLNQAIANALQEVNRRTQFHSLTTITIPVYAQSGDGPQWFDLSGHVRGTQNVINTVKRCVYDDGNGNIFRLKPRDWRQFDREGRVLDIQPPSVPQWFFLEAYKLAIFPASVTSATLTLWCGTGLINFCNDQDTLDELPIDYEEVLEDMAVVKVRKYRPDQPNAQAQLALYTPDVERGIDDIIKWLNRGNEALQPSLVLASRRRERWV